MALSDIFAMLALVISLISLLISYNLNREERRTRCLSRLVEAEIKCKVLLNNLEKMVPSRTDCRANHEVAIAGVDSILKCCMKMKRDVVSLSDYTRMISIEKYLREAEEIYLRIEYHEKRIASLSDDCRECHERSRKIYESLPPEKRPKKFTCDLYKQVL